MQKAVTLKCPWCGSSLISLSLASWSASPHSPCWTTRYVVLINWLKWLPERLKQLCRCKCQPWGRPTLGHVFLPVFIFMIIYQVDYDNHPLYKHGKTGRKQSPVRLFTNISPKDVVLPKDEGYRYQQLGCDHIIRHVGVIKLVLMNQLKYSASIF